MKKKAIAKKFCPILRFDKEEKYTPTNFIELFRKDGDIKFECSDPQKMWEKKAKFDNKTKLNWFVPVVYVHFLEDIKIVVRRKIRKVPLVIQYYYYFAYNDYYWGVFQVPFLTHPHDWELIQVALDSNYKIISYSISSHGTFLGIGSQSAIDLHTEEGFRFNKGGHNLGSIFQMANKPRKNDIKIETDTLIPTSDDKYSPYKDSIILLDEEFKIDYLIKFSFLPVSAPWRKQLFNANEWKPEFWSWSFRQFIKQGL